MEVKFTVNELSKIVGISSRNIRYYDSIGLFKASGTLENGYRYYTIDKIEEIYIINYLRHMGISIKEIKTHLENRNIDEYDSILNNQLNKVNEEISKLQIIKHKLQRRLASVDYIHNIPKLEEISIQFLPGHRIISFHKEIKKQIDWEIALKKISGTDDSLPNIFIGDIGFFVDMKKIKSRKAEEFSGMFLLADDYIYNSHPKTSKLPSGKWLTIFIRGNHHEAINYYPTLLAYAENHSINLGSYAVERTIIDHYISSNPNFYITEILIPIVD